MENVAIEHFHHRRGVKPSVVTAGPADTLREVLIRLGPLEEGIFVFVGECDYALKEPADVEDGADEHEPVDIDLTLAVLEIVRHRHVHVHKCRHIGVEVNFNGKTKRHKFAPNTTVGVATDWARKKFHLDPALASEYILQLCNSTVQPRSDEHLGDIVRGEACSICFDLVKEMTPKG
jgi:hypothetical protein